MIFVIILPFLFMRVKKYKKAQIITRRMQGQTITLIGKYKKGATNDRKRTRIQYIKKTTG